MRIIAEFTNSTFGNLKISEGAEEISVDLDHMDIVSHIIKNWKRLILSDIEKYFKNIGDRSTFSITALYRQTDVESYVSKKMPLVYKVSNNIFRSYAATGGPALFLIPNDSSVVIILNSMIFEASRSSVERELVNYCELVLERASDAYSSIKKIWATRDIFSDEQERVFSCIQAEELSVLRDQDISLPRIRLAARSLSGVVDGDTKSEVLRCVINKGFTPTENFKRLRTDIQRAVRSNIAISEPYEIGYDAAKLCRQVIDQIEEIQPEVLLASFSIPVILATLPQSVDGVSFSSSGKCGIIINVSGRHSRTVNGRNFTLLHELGHLLIEFSALEEDNFEIKHKGNQSRFEKIANAFAAEMIIPRKHLEVIAQESRNDLNEIMHLANKRFRAGPHVTTYQITNAASVLSALSVADQHSLALTRNRVESSRYWSD
jgi:hypothetical protein